MREKARLIHILISFRKSEGTRQGPGTSCLSRRVNRGTTIASSFHRTRNANAIVYARATLRVCFLFPTVTLALSPWRLFVHGSFRFDGAHSLLLRRSLSCRFIFYVLRKCLSMYKFLFSDWVKIISTRIKIFSRVYIYISLPLSLSCVTVNTDRKSFREDDLLLGTRNDNPPTWVISSHSLYARRTKSPQMDEASHYASSRTNLRFVYSRKMKEKELTL